MNDEYRNPCLLAGCAQRVEQARFLRTEGAYILCAHNVIFHASLEHRAKSEANTTSRYLRAQLVLQAVSCQVWRDHRQPS